MRKSNLLSNKLICFFIALFMFAMFFSSNLFFNKNQTSANDITPGNNPRTTSTHSTFIHSPTYSFIYHQEIYFFDEYDNCLKVYNITDAMIEDASLSVLSLGTILDVVYQGEYIFALSSITENSIESLSISLIDLIDFEIEKTIELENFKTDYKNISVCEVDDSWLISLTPIANESETSSPAIITLDKTNKEITNTCLLSIESQILNTLFNLTVIESAGTNENDIYIVLTCNETIYFFGTAIEKVTTETLTTIETSKSSLYENLETTSANIELAEVNTIIVNNKLMFLITYNETADEGLTITGTYSKLYEYAIDVIDEEKSFESVLKLVTQVGEYVTTANSCVLYPIKNEQKIIYTQISYNTENQKYSDTTMPHIKNPNVEVVFRTENNFEFVTANKTTKLLSSPWAHNNDDNYEILEAHDLIIIGHGKISGENSVIEGYDYCLITTANENKKGFVKSEDLTSKQIISVENYDYKVFKVQPYTPLYSLPTTIVGDRITDSLNSTIISKIEENSKVELVDAICKYKSNEKIMLKVIVNDTETGYIEFDRIIKPSESINFVITNASIKSDNTIIYLNSNPSSPIIGTLDKGYRIRINGTRNTETGYTSITFNDEYGNEFTGYILTDSIGSDSWTTMQIIGCVLIAINVGLLILILRFKKKNIGNDGSKYIENKK